MSVIIGTANDDDLSGTEDADDISGGDGRDFILGEGGDDVVDTGEGRPENEGGGGDGAHGGDGDDQITGGGGHDSLVGGAGMDILTGGDGDDVLDGGLGTGFGVQSFQSFIPVPEGGTIPVIFRNFHWRLWLDDGAQDTMDGGAGDDSVTAGVGDIADGGEGDDSLTATFRGSAVGVSLDLRTDAEAALEAALGATLSNFEHYDVVGSEHDDIVQLRTDGLYDAAYGMGGDDALTGGDGENFLLGGDGADVLTGGAGDDTIYANQGLIDGPGALLSYALDDGEVDIVSGGDGDDTVFLGSGDQADGGAGTNRLWVTFMGEGAVELDASGDAAEAQAAIASALGATLAGFSSFDIWGSSGNDVITTGEFIVNLSGGGGDDTLSASRAAGHLLRGDDGADTLIGGSGYSLILTGAGDNLVFAGAGDDRIDIGFNGRFGEIAEEGRNYVDGEAGSDYVVFGPSYFDYEVISGAGFLALTRDDTVTIVENVETLYFDDLKESFRPFPLDFTSQSGDAGDNSLNGDAGDNRIDGGEGADTLDGGDGDDRLDGGVGDDTLTGGAGANLLIGGAGGDIYSVASAHDVIVERLGQGYDQVIASVDYRLGANIERLDLVGPAIVGEGNGRANAIHGNALANLLYGRAGDDSLRGDVGDDSLRGDLGDDTLDGGEGADTANFFFSNAGLTAGVVLDGSATGVAGSVAVDDGLNGTDTLIDVERIAATGSEFADVLIGGAGDDSLSGVDGDDTLEGGLGADDIAGGYGDDELNGGDGRDILDGGAGADTLVGGLDHDVYYIDDRDDRVVELRGQGADKVASSVDYNALKMGGNVETIVLTGTARTAIGDVFDNRLVGNASQNVLNGYKGADTMEGRGGNDLYTVDNIGDVVIEAAGGGIDTVSSAISFTLTEHLENLFLLGGADLSATGNDGLNTIRGNRGDNMLTGGGGVDILTGGNGPDTFVYTAVSDSTYVGYDRIMDLDDDDTIDLSAVDANANVGGDQDFILVDSFSRSAGEMILDDSRAGLTFLVGDTDGDGKGDFRIALIGDHGDFDGFLGAG